MESGNLDGKERDEKLLLPHDEQLLNNSEYIQETDLLNKAG